MGTSSRWARGAVGSRGRQSCIRLCSEDGITPPDHCRSTRGPLDSDGKADCQWRIDDGTVLDTYAGHTDQVFAVDILPDQQHALSGAFDNTIRLWRLSDGETVRVFTGHTGGIRSIKITPDGEHVLSGSEDGTLKLWRIADGECLRTFTGHTQRICALTWYAGLPAAVPEVGTRLAFSVAPNPGRERLRISGYGDAKEIRIADVLGRIVYRAQPAGGSTDLRLDRAGVFFVTVTAGGRSATRRVIICR